MATTTLYVAVGRALDLPLHAQLIPSHLLACWSDGRQRLNIGTTARGQVVSDLSLLARFAIDEGQTYYGWMQPLTDRQLLAEYDRIAAQHLAGCGEYADARRHLDQVRKVLPQRHDLALLDLSCQAAQSGDRTDLRAEASRLADD